MLIIYILLLVLNLIKIENINIIIKDFNYNSISNLIYIAIYNP
jgi:hypothetical protein